MSDKQTKITELVDLFFSMRTIFKDIAHKRKDFNIFSAVQLEALCFIQEHKKPTMTELASYLNISPPSTTSLITVLVKNKEIERIRTELDRRTVRLAITSAGKRKLSQSMSFFYTELGKKFETLTSKELEDFIRILKKITR